MEEIINYYYQRAREGLKTDFERLRSLGWPDLPEVNARLAEKITFNNIAIKIEVEGDGEQYISVRTLSEGLTENSDLAKQYLANLNNIKDEFYLFNALSYTESFFILLHDKKIKGKMINITIFGQNRKGESFFCPKILMVLGEGVKAEVTLKYHDLGDEKSFINNVFDIYCYKNSNLLINNLKLGKKNDYILENINIYQAQNSKSELFYFSTGCKYIRNNTICNLEKTKAKIVIRALTIAQGQSQIVDYGRVEHFGAKTESDQLYKTVLLDEAKTEFKGEVKINKKAKKSIANQLNRNLLLSDKAKAITRPQMRILTDDVECHHGASIGQFDDDELFYFLSRGINEEAAKKMLTLGFCGEIIEGFSSVDFRKEVLNLIKKNI